MRVELEGMRLFREQKYKKIFSKQILRAFGIEEGTHITERFAHQFFERLQLKRTSSAGGTDI
jgi:hypothetical protein